MSGGGSSSGSLLGVSTVLNGLLATGVWLLWGNSANSACGAEGVESAVRELRWTARLGGISLLALLGLLGWAVTRGHLDRLGAAGGVVVHTSAVSHGVSWGAPAAAAATVGDTAESYFIGDEPTDEELAVYVPRGPRGAAK